jgi:hypothetical protein
MVSALIRCARAKASINKSSFCPLSISSLRCTCETAEADHLRQHQTY